MKRERHGDSVPSGDRRLYRLYYKIKARCYNPNQAHYSLYGGKGIKMCREWEGSYVSFRDWSYSNGYKDGLQIDRINPKGNYSPDNCRWVTTSEQARNKSNNIKYLGECARDASERLGGGRTMVANRLALGWGKARAFTAPPGNRGVKSIKHKKTK